MELCLDYVEEEEEDTSISQSINQLTFSGLSIGTLLDVLRRSIYEGNRDVAMWCARECHLMSSKSAESFRRAVLFIWMMSFKDISPRDYSCIVKTADNIRSYYQHGDKNILYLCRAVETLICGLKSTLVLDFIDSACRSPKCAIVSERKKVKKMKWLDHMQNIWTSFESKNLWWMIFHVGKFINNPAVVHQEYKKFWLEIMKRFKYVLKDKEEGVRNITDKSVIFRTYMFNCAEANDDKIIATVGALIHLHFLTYSKPEENHTSSDHINSTECDPSFNWETDHRDGFDAIAALSYLNLRSDKTDTQLRTPPYVVSNVIPASPPPSKDKRTVTEAAGTSGSKSAKRDMFTDLLNPKRKGIVWSTEMMDEYLRKRPHLNEKLTDASTGAVRKKSAQGEAAAEMAWEKQEPPSQNAAAAAAAASASTSEENPGAKHPYLSLDGVAEGPVVFCKREKGPQTICYRADADGPLRIIREVASADLMFAFTLKKVGVSGLLLNLPTGEFGLARTNRRYSELSGVFEPTVNSLTVFESGCPYATNNRVYLSKHLEARLSKFTLVRKRILSTLMGQKQLIQIMLFRLIFGLTTKYSHVVWDADTDNLYSLDENDIQCFNRHTMLRVSSNSKLFRDLHQADWADAVPEWLKPNASDFTDVVNQIMSIGKQTGLSPDKLYRVKENVTNLPQLIVDLVNLKEHQSIIKQEVSFQ